MYIENGVPFGTQPRHLECADEKLPEQQQEEIAGISPPISPSTFQQDRTGLNLADNSINHNCEFQIMEEKKVKREVEYIIDLSFCPLNRVVNPLFLGRHCK